MSTVTGVLAGRYNQWRRKALAKQRNKGPGRMLLGLLIPVLIGFAVAKTDFGSKRAKHAANSISHRLHLPKVATVSSSKAEAAHEGVPINDTLARMTTEQPEAAEVKIAEAPQNRKFLGIF